MWKKSNLKQFSIRQKQQNVKKMNEYICKALYIHIYTYNKLASFQDVF